MIQEDIWLIVEIEQITNDHSFVNHLVMIGQISAEEAFNHPQKILLQKLWVRIR